MIMPLDDSAACSQKMKEGSGDRGVQLSRSRSTHKLDPRDITESDHSKTCALARVKELQPTGFARVRSFSNPAIPVVHRLRGHPSSESFTNNSLESCTVRSSSEREKSLQAARSGMTANGRCRSTAGSLKQEIRRRTSPEPPSSSSTMRLPKSTLQYSAPGSTRQLATFCEEERARFWSSKLAKSEEPLKWTAQPVPRRLLGLSVVLSFLSRLWSALVKCTCLGKFNTQAAMMSRDTMQLASNSVPKIPSPLADSGNGTSKGKYPLSIKRWEHQTLGLLKRKQPEPEGHACWKPPIKET